MNGVRILLQEKATGLNLETQKEIEENWAGGRNTLGGREVVDWLLDAEHRTRESENEEN